MHSADPMPWRERYGRMKTSPTPGTIEISAPSGSTGAIPCRMAAVRIRCGL